MSNNNPESLEKRALFNRFRRSANEAIQQEKRAQKTKRTVPRPPYAIDEALFLEICNGCGDCVKVCPTEIITLQQDKAYLNLDMNHCTHCGQCVDSCDSNALNRTESNKIDAIPKFTSNCNNYLGTRCQVCVSSCPQNAISIAPEQLPKVDESLCDGCSICRSDCYMGSVVMEIYTHL